MNIRFLGLPLTEEAKGVTEIHGNILFHSVGRNLPRGGALGEPFCESPWFRGRPALSGVCWRVGASLQSRGRLPVLLPPCVPVSMAAINIGFPVTDIGQRMGIHDLLFWSLMPPPLLVPFFIFI